MKYKYLYSSLACLALPFSTFAFSQVDAVETTKVSRDASLPIKKQSMKEANAEDMLLVAKARGWTVAEAEADRKMADHIGAIAVKFAAKYPDKFVGSVLSEQPGGTPSIYMKGEATREIHEMVEASGIHVNMVDRQPYSFKELEKRQQQVNAQLQEMGYKQSATYFDFQDGGKIYAEVTQQKGLPERARGVMAAFPESLKQDVSLTMINRPIGTFHSIFGGMTVRGSGNCTTGWSLIHEPSGITGVTTAGHCRYDEIIEPGVGVHNLLTLGQHIGPWGDIEWGFNSLAETPEFYARSNQVRDVTSVEPRAGISVGESICFYGRASNTRRCDADVAATSVTCGLFNPFTNSFNVVDRMVLMDREASIPGDSGGGWSWANKAYGSLIGICMGGSVFSVADLYDEALGLDVTVRLPWTDWLSRDFPSGSGDFEQRHLFPPADVCSSPLNIQARVIGTTNIFTPSDSRPEPLHQLSASPG